MAWVSYPSTSAAATARTNTLTCRPPTRDASTTSPTLIASLIGISPDINFRIDYSHNGLPGERCQSQFAAVRNAPSAVRQSTTTDFVGMTFGCLAFRLGVREGHLT